MLSSFEFGIPIGIAMCALYGMLAVTSLSVRFAMRRAVSGMLSKQVNAWWRIFPVVSLALLTYPLGLVLLAYLICLLASFELATCYPGPANRFRAGAAATVLAISLLYWCVPALVPIVLTGLMAVRAIRLPEPRALVWLLLLMTVGAMVTVVAFSRLPFGPAVKLAWLFYLFALTALNDIGQFVAGRLFGRNKIAPTISPNKTLQGLLGGLVASQLASHSLGAYLKLATPMALATYGMVLSLGGLAGDLMFSAAKRRLSIKDFSQLIPGHGGILDRVDSLILTAPLLYCLLCAFA